MVEQLLPASQPALCLPSECVAHLAPPPPPPPPSQPACHHVSSWMADAPESFSFHTYILFILSLNSNYGAHTLYNTPNTHQTAFLVGSNTSI